MTRPQIVRADTLDLQDKHSPTAQDHTHQPAHPAPLGIGPAAPHQEASLRRVEDERSSEEARLQSGNWQDTNGVQSEHRAADDQTASKHANGNNAATRLNGDLSGEGDEAELADEDAEEDLDDMDRISSSPSISDGGLPSHSTLHMEPGSSMSPDSSPIISPPSSSNGCESSPFVDTPIHFPLSMAAIPRLHPVLAGSPNLVSLSSFSSSSSPTPLSFSSQNSHHAQSADHHHGEYAWTRTTGPDGTTPEFDLDPNTNPTTEHLAKVEQRLQAIRLDSMGSLLSEHDEEAVKSMLEPVPSPLIDYLEDPFTDEIPKRTSSLPPTRNQDVLQDEVNDDTPWTLGPYEEDEWTTDSDADSWDAYQDKDDDTNDVSLIFSDDPRYIDSGWGGECLREIEEIDFEFVYSLHTFVATVEGQANATKGDTMVLLDDSNSYWWLVRVVKDNSIGYLPAEHIETPTERLARLNKHRNIDLSATMLGDTAEKPKNPLKKAMRRRNAKTVQFAQPQYFEPSDYDYSSDEDGDEELFGGSDPSQAQVQQQETAAKPESEQDDNLQVQPLKVNGTKKDPKNKSDSELAEIDEYSKGDTEKTSSEETFDKPLDPKVSRNGTMRNTDSFFKDENTETRKITLTPNLLRDDSSTSTTGSRERGPSLESLEKNGFADKVKEDKKKKEKKPGMLSGLFKRKDRKSKVVGMDSVDSDVEPSSKQSEEYGRESPQSKPSDELSVERTSTEQNLAPMRQPSKGKLQKLQRGREDSPSKVVKGILKMDSPEPSTSQPEAAKEPANDKPAIQPTSTMRLVPAGEEEPRPSEEGANSAASKVNPIAIIKNHGAQQDGDGKPEKVKKAKQRMQLDDFDSDDEGKMDPFADPDVHNHSTQQAESEPTGRLSESPVHVSVADAQPPNDEATHEKDQESDSHPPGLTGDTSSQETSSPISTPTPDDSPSTTQPSQSLPTSASLTSTSPTEPNSASSILPPLRPAPVPEKDMEASPLGSSESTSLPAWSDSSLRTYLDDGSDIRDMLLVINDTTGVVPVGPEHPIMSQLFVEETKTISGLSTQLDSLLNGLLEKRMKRLDNGASPVSGR